MQQNAFEDTRPLSRQEFIGEIGDILERCMGDTAEFAKTFMPNRFDRPFDPPYAEIFKILDDDTIKQGVIAAPRGTGKTSIDAIAFPARRICYQESKFIVIVSATHALAAKIVKQLGRELVENPNIRKIFGPLKGDRWAEGEGDLRTSTGISILARGAGQQVRGLLEDRRPDLILIDDLEDSEPFRIGDASEYVRKTEEWLDADLLNIIDRASKTTRVLYLGTILGENSVLNNLLENPDWHSIRLELCDDNYETNFPGLMSTEAVKALADSLRRKGKIDTFFREYRNLPIAGEAAVFRKERFKYWTPELRDKHPLQKAVIVDPAKTLNVKSADSAIVGVGFSSRAGLLQLDTVNAKLAPEEIYSTAYEMAMRIGTRTIACETTSLELFITYPFNQFLRKKGFPEIIPLKAQGHKADRIKELAPLYSMGNVWHHPEASVNQALEAQLLAFPRSRFWDVMDAFAYALKLFTIGNINMMMDDIGTNDSFEAKIAEMDKLDRDMAPFDGWHTSP